MRAIPFAAAAALAALALAGCAGTTTPTASTITRTVTVMMTAPTATAATATPSTEPAAQASSYGPNHAYAVGTPQGGLDESIPPGRYRASTDAESGGFVYHCDSVLCSKNGDHTNSDSIEHGAPVVVEISSSDVAIYLWDATLVPVS
jgi:hypothetical protein